MNLPLKVDAARADTLQMMTCQERFIGVGDAADLLADRETLIKRVEALEEALGNLVRAASNSNCCSFTCDKAKAVLAESQP